MCIQKMSIHFKSFRRQPIEHLVSIYPEQHGIVLNHSMGTGKTITSCLFLANYELSEYEILIIAPPKTHMEWRKSIEMVGRHDPSSLHIHIHSLHKDFVADLPLHTDFQNPQKFLVVIDEAHNLADILTDDTFPMEKKHAFTNWLNQVYKVMLLTGTPFRNNITDICCLVNLAAGKVIVPNNEQDFIKKYYKLDKSKVALHGWISPIMYTYLHYFQLPVLSLMKTMTLTIITYHLTAFYGLKQHQDKDFNKIESFVEFFKFHMLKDRKIKVEGDKESYLINQYYPSLLPKLYTIGRTMLDHFQKITPDDIAKDKLKKSQNEKPEFLYEWVYEKMFGSREKEQKELTEKDISDNVDYLFDKFFPKDVQRFMEDIDIYNSNLLLKEDAKNEMDEVEKKAQIKMMLITQTLSIFEIWQPSGSNQNENSNVPFSVLEKLNKQLIGLKQRLANWAIYWYTHGNKEAQYAHFVMDAMKNMRTGYSENVKKHSDFFKKSQKVLVPITNFLFGNPGQAINHLAKIPSLPIFLLVWFTAKIVMYTLNRMRQVEDLYTLRISNLSRDIQPYISVFNPFLVKSKNNLDILQHFPKASVSFREYRMTTQQTMFMYKIMLNLISEEDMLFMGVVKEKNDLMFVRTSKDIDYYKNIGRISGSLCFKRESNPKFEQIFREYKKKRQPTLVFSNFIGGISHFHKAASSRGYRVKFLPTGAEDIAEKKRILRETLDLHIDFLLLPPDAKEGVDVPGIRVFHILEPCMDIIKHNQLCARVQRYNHLSTEQYKVNIYVWWGTDIGMVQKVYTKLRMWNTYGKKQVPWIYFKNFKNLPSPDLIAVRDLERMGTYYTRIQSKIMRWSADESGTQKQVHGSNKKVYDPTQPS